jgi:hypothetical protein
VSTELIHWVSARSSCACRESRPRL